MKYRSLLMFPIVVLVAIMMVSGLYAETTTSADTFADKDGTTYFAVGIKAPTPPEAAQAFDVAIMVETSATQTKEVKQTALNTLKTTIGNLPEGTRVQLFGVDVNATALTEEFVAVGDPALEEAITQLEAVVPLGATDLANGLQMAVDSFDSESEAAPVMVYIGSGLSDAKPLDVNSELIGDLVYELQVKQIPLNFFAVGEALDLPVMGLFANQSGGMVLTDSPAETLASAITSPVFWVEGAEALGPENAEVYPMPIPPLRTDRETILVGQVEGGLEPFEIQLSLDSYQTGADVAWKCIPAESEDFNAYLTDVVSSAASDGGSTFFVAGREWLDWIKNNNIESNLEKTGLALQAEQSGNTKEAQAIADSVNLPVVSSSLLDRAETAVETMKTETAFVDRVAQSQSLIDTQLTKEINHTLDVARKMMRDDPDGAQNILRLSIQQIGQETAISPERRQSLLNQLENAAREASRQTYLVEVDRQQARERYFAQIERNAINEAMKSQTERISAIMKRCSALMAAKEYSNAEVLAQNIRDEARRIGDTAPAMMAQVARWTNTLDLYETYKVKRDIGLVDNVINLHKTNITISDDHVLTYPDPEIWTLLSQVRRARYKAMDLRTKTESEKMIEKSFDEVVSLNVEERPLSELIEEWSQDFGINIYIDLAAFTDEGLESDPTITLTVSSIKFRNLLNLVLTQHGMAFCIHDEVLLITTPEKAAEYLVTKVYPVADLVINISDAQQDIQSSGNSGGSNNGSYGGGGNNSRGGGNNSRGGGGGGWNIPSSYNNLIRQGLINNALIQQRPLDNPTGQKVFNVIDKAVKPDHSESKKQVSANIKALGPEVDKNSPEQVWTAVFNTISPNDDLIKHAAHELMKKQQFRAAASVIYRAMQLDRAEDWMYGLLPMALEAADAPVAEQERALLSSAPYIASPMERLTLGASLERIGAKKRAMQFYREVTLLDPGKAEPYLYAVRLADELDDEAAKKWVCLGIASHEWQGEHITTVRDRGMDIYEGLVKKMHSEGRHEEADQFERNMHLAMARDCVVELEYVGDADVELMVKEPAETICWYNQPRTTSGGILSLSKQDLSSPTKKKSYVCQEGFSGKYEVLAKKFWGTVPSGKVKIRVTTHKGTENERFEEQFVPLNEENGAVKVVFDLDNGRRTGSLDEAIVDNAINEQKINRDLSLLSRKINMESSNAILADTMTSNDNANSSSNYNGWGPWWLPQSAVGYQLEIERIPAVAAMWYAVAVVSADRCYVRVSPNPEFSQIVDVFTYNSMTGESSSSNNSNNSNSNNSNSNNSNSNSNNSSSSGSSW